MGKEILQAIFKAKQEFTKIERRCKNPFYNSKYADLEAIHDGIDKSLVKYGLLVTHPIEVLEVDGIFQECCSTYIYHTETGQCLKSSIPLRPDKPNNPQAQGSAITYASRYGLTGLLGIVTEDDDDGNAGSINKKESTQKYRTASPEPPKQPSSQSADKSPTETTKTPQNIDDDVTEQQIKAINTILSQRGITDDFERHKKVSELLALPETITSLSKLSKFEASMIIKALGEEK